MRGFLLGFFLLLIWQGVVILFHLPSFILPGPIQVSKSIWNNHVILLDSLFSTSLETILGLCFGVVLGILLAICLQQFKTVRFWLLPILILSQTVPLFAFAPILVLWFGYGLFSKMMTVSLMLFFPIASACYDGLQKTSKSWVEMAEIMSSSNWRTLWYIRFPAAMPNLISGLRVAVVFAPMGAIVSEWVGASSGLGFLMLNANARLEIDLMFACVVVIMIFSLALYWGIMTLLHKLGANYLKPWRSS